MNVTKTGTRITIKNILYLTDFSQPSEAALPFAASIARAYGSKVYALHVLPPSELIADVIAAYQERAEKEMLRLATQLGNLPYETIVERDAGIWPTVERTLERYGIDLVVIGTHGRTGAEKILLGSVAEEIFRRSTVPVLTIGPWARSRTNNGEQFHRVLFATDLTPDSLSAAPYAVSFAQENQAGLILFHVIHDPEQPTDMNEDAVSVANALYLLDELVPADAELWCRPERLVEYGNPSERILEVARRRAVDLIVLGVRGAGKHLGAATHLENATAHKVVAHATCPVLTVRG